MPVVLFDYSILTHALVKKYTRFQVLYVPEAPLAITWYPRASGVKMAAWLGRAEKKDER